MMFANALTVTTALLGLFGGGAGGQSSQPQFAELSPEDIVRLDQQRSVVASAAKARYGTVRLAKTREDLPVLQRLIDDQVFAKTQTYELQCLGVAFGDVLASDLALHWVMVTDEYGTDPTLRLKNTTIHVNSLTMISKRIERGDPVNLRELVRINHEQVTTLEKKLARQ